MPEAERRNINKLHLVVQRAGVGELGKSKNAVVSDSGVVFRVLEVSVVLHLLEAEPRLLQDNWLFFVEDKLVEVARVVYSVVS